MKRAPSAWSGQSGPGSRCSRESKKRCLSGFSNSLTSEWVARASWERSKMEVGQLVKRKSVMSRSSVPAGHSPLGIPPAPRVVFLFNCFPHFSLQGGGGSSTILSSNARLSPFLSCMSVPYFSPSPSPCPRSMLLLPRRHKYVWSPRFSALFPGGARVVSMRHARGLRFVVLALVLSANMFWAFCIRLEQYDFPARCRPRLVLL